VHFSIRGHTCERWVYFSRKYALYTHGMDDTLSTNIEGIFPFQHLEFDGGLRYLGFNLKPNHYGKED
jgi:hypothetical protein